MGGETLGQILTRDEMKILARKFGKATTATLMLNQGKEMFMEDFNEKNENWNNRMNNFARNLNDHFKQLRTLYAEERNVANKEKIEDRWGLSQAYSSPTGIVYKTGSTTLYIVVPVVKMAILIKIYMMIYYYYQQEMHTTHRNTKMQWK